MTVILVARSSSGPASTSNATTIPTASVAKWSGEGSAVMEKDLSPRGISKKAVTTLDAQALNRPLHDATSFPGWAGPPCP